MRFTKSEIERSRAYWTTQNAEARAAGCQCGAPATECRTSPVIGDVVQEIWTCAEHVGVGSWVSDGVTWSPQWRSGNPCRECKTNPFACAIEYGPNGQPVAWHHRSRPSDLPATETEEQT